MYALNLKKQQKNSVYVEKKKYINNNIYIYK